MTSPTAVRIEIESNCESDIAIEREIRAVLDVIHRIGIRVRESEIGRPGAIARIGGRRAKNIGRLRKLPGIRRRGIRNRYGSFRHHSSISLARIGLGTALRSDFKIILAIQLPEVAGRNPDRSESGEDDESASKSECANEQPHRSRSLSIRADAASSACDISTPTWA